jgi:hypothetical protein
MLELAEQLVSVLDDEQLHTSRISTPKAEQ